MGADTAPNTGADVQADGANGADAQGNPLQGLYDLNSVPEELHPYAEGLLQQVSRNVDSKFREHSDFRKRFERFDGIEGLDELDPEGLQDLLAFNRITDDEDQFKSWLQAASAEVGYSPDLSEEDWAALGAQNGWLDDDGADGEGLNEDGSDPRDEKIAALEAELGEIRQWREQSDHKAQMDDLVAQSKEEAETDLGSLREEHGEFDEDEVIGLARLYADQDHPVLKSFEHYQRIRGNGQSDLLDEKTGQPNTALSAGQANTAPQTFTLDDPGLKEAAKARLAASR